MTGLLFHLKFSMISQRRALASDIASSLRAGYIASRAFQIPPFWGDKSEGIKNGNVAMSEKPSHIVGH